MFGHFLDAKSCRLGLVPTLRNKLGFCFFFRGRTHDRPLDGGKTVPSDCVLFYISPTCFLPVLLELNNPGYSHYKSCCLDARPQTGDRLCNLVSFSIPLGFMGRCLTLPAGYLLVTLKATFFLLTSQLGAHSYNVCRKKIKTSTVRSCNSCYLCFFCRAVTLRMAS